MRAVLLSVVLGAAPLVVGVLASVTAEPALAAQRAKPKKPAKKARPIPKESRPAPKPVEPPREVAPKEVPAEPTPSAEPRGPTRIDFDDRLIQGQTNKSGAVYLFDRKETGISSMVRRRKSFRQLTLGTIYDR